MEQMQLYTGSGNAKESVIDKEEYGTYVQKDKKKKKKKEREPTRAKEIDEEKIKEQALESELYQVKDLTAEEKHSFAIAENHPLKLICNNLPFKITIEEVFQYFNTVISASNP